MKRHAARIKRHYGLGRLVWTLATLGTAQATAPEIVLHNFAYQADGASPQTGVVRDPAGNLFGTTTIGGTANAGVVYKVSASGIETVLHTFTGRTDGGQPQAGVILDSAGNLYGTTLSGGTAGQGLVFKMSPSGKETVLYNFTGQSDGGQPRAGVILDSSGNLYGTTAVGGTAGAGTVYKLDAAGQETVLHSFTGSADGAMPQAGLIRDLAGNLYGTTTYGGTGGGGVVFKLDTTAHETVIHSFIGGADGSLPFAGVVRDAAGNLYGTTYSGGPWLSGVAYKLDPSGQETILHSFSNGTDGGLLQSGLILDPAGNLYGAAYNGGPQGMYSQGLVYKLSPSGAETVLYNFALGANGCGPKAGVIRDPSGNLYGTTVLCGKTDLGVVYKLDPTGNETVVYNFAGGTDGYAPLAGVVRSSAGNLYGTTQNGGPANAGVVFSLDAAGKETVLYSFTGAADGGYPLAGVTLDSTGNLYGTTYGGGSAKAGVVFELDASGQETVLYSFSGGVDGAFPQASVMRDSAGNLYGTTSSGGASGAGVVYELDATGHETVLYSFTGGADGGYPSSGLIRDSAGNLYGTTPYGGTAGAGVVFKVDTTGHETVLYTFTGLADGSEPNGGLVRDSAGNLYGTTYGGGGYGDVFEVDPTGHETVLYSFTGGADGRYPFAGVMRDSAGNLYGTTYYGGPAGAGVVYKLNTTGVETVLYSFTGGADGGQPQAGVIGDSIGNLYGTTSIGGKTLGGVVYKVRGAAE